MRKYKLISALAEETAKEVVRNEENWRRYLNTASRLYKYPFKEQLLIYAQRPEATACASIEIWNEKMHCWVNKGAKGIALIDEDIFSGLKYVFDISDVHKARRIGQFPNLWEMREEHMESVISRLEKTYGDTDREAGFVGRIREIAGRIAEDCYKELASDMEYLKEGSFLEELDELNVEVRIRETLEGYRTDIQTYTAHKPVDKDVFSMKIGNRTYTDKKEAGAALIDMCRSAKQPNMAVTIGEYQGFKMSVSFDSFFSKFTVSLKGSLSHEVEIGADPLGNLQRLSNALEGMTGKMADVEQKLSNVEHQLETAKVEVTKPFAQEQELAEKLERLAELNALLNMDEKGDNALDMGDDEPEDENGEQSAQAQEGEPDRAEDIQAVADEPLKPVASFLMSERIAEHDKERMLADGSRGRVSVKEKLAEMKQKISDQKMPEKPETVKSKGKEESL